MAKKNDCPEGYFLNDANDCEEIKKTNWKKIGLIALIVAAAGIGIWLLYPVIADLFVS